MDLQQIIQDLTAAVEDAKKQAYDDGFKAGVASVPAQPVSDKIYSQAELDAKVQEAVSQLQAELDTLKASVPVQIADAVAALKADLLKKYQDAKVAEQALETGFVDLLK